MSERPNSMSKFKIRHLGLCSATRIGLVTAHPRIAAVGIREAVSFVSTATFLVIFVSGFAAAESSVTAFWIGPAFCAQPFALLRGPSVLAHHAVATQTVAAITVKIAWIVLRFTCCSTLSYTRVFRFLTNVISAAISVVRTTILPRGRAE